MGTPTGKKCENPKQRASLRASVLGWTKRHKCRKVTITGEERKMSYGNKVHFPNSSQPGFPFSEDHASFSWSRRATGPRERHRLLLGRKRNVRLLILQWRLPTSNRDAKETCVGTHVLNSFCIFHAASSNVFSPRAHTCDLNCHDPKELFRATNFGECARGEGPRGILSHHPHFCVSPLSYVPLRYSNSQRHRLHVLALLAEPASGPRRLISREKLIHRVFTDSTIINLCDSFIDTTFDKINTFS